MLRNIVKMEQSAPKHREDGAECSETSAKRIQKPENHPKKEYNIVIFLLFYPNILDRDVSRLVKT